MSFGRRRPIIEHRGRENADKKGKYLTEHTFSNVVFPSVVIREAMELIATLIASGKKPDITCTASITSGPRKRSFRTPEDFLTALDSKAERASLQMTWSNTPQFDLSFTQRSSGEAEVGVATESLADDERVLAVFEQYDRTRTPFKPVLFIGHGHNNAWCDLRDDLRDLHGYTTLSYESTVRAAHPTRDVLEKMLSKCDAGILVFTPEDKMANGEKHPRQNVTHELGLCQGRLGWTRGIAVVESGTTVPSNFSAHELRYEPGHIRTCMSAILAHLNDEFAAKPAKST